MDKYLLSVIETSSKAYFGDALEPEFTRFEVFESSGNAYGSVYKFANQDIAVLCGLIVKPSSRRKGLGKALHEFRIELAKDMGAKTVKIWIDPKAPDWLREWYKRMGYKQTKDTTDDGQVWYEKELQS